MRMHKFSLTPTDMSYRFVVPFGGRSGTTWDAERVVACVNHDGWASLRPLQSGLSSSPASVVADNGVRVEKYETITRSVMFEHPQVFL